MIIFIIYWWISIEGSYFSFGCCCKNWGILDFPIPSSLFYFFSPCVRSKNKNDPFCLQRLYNGDADTTFIHRLRHYSVADLMLELKWFIDWFIGSYKRLYRIPSTNGSWEIPHSSRWPKDFTKFFTKGLASISVFKTWGYAWLKWIVIRCVTLFPHCSTSIKW